MTEKTTDVPQVEKKSEAEKATDILELEKKPEVVQEKPQLLGSHFPTTCSTEIDSKDTPSLENQELYSKIEASPEDSLQGKVLEGENSTGKKSTSSKNTIGKSSKVRKQDEVSLPKSRPVRASRSQTPQKKASPSAEENRSNAENTANTQKRIRRLNAKATIKDDATRIKTRVKYLMNRINREQSLIDAYAADGWKGQSQEKVRPEQELKRAEMQISQCKLAIRRELEQLHMLSLEGTIQEGAFDEDGQIYFDDIFCAICKSKEAFAENDIILCDGACNRAFHQFCLVPPLKTEDIPPGDEGWLCPICDCKFDCLDAINDNFGTDLEIEDSWEKVFAEVKEDVQLSSQNIGVSEVDWPSEDSEDDDYNPEKPIISEQDGSAKDNVSNDEEDDSDSSSDSSSDFNSDSSEGSGVVFFDEFAGSTKGKKRAHAGDDETEDLSDVETMVSVKRQRPDVDYKQLYDEVYGTNASDYDSDEDEDWGEIKRTKDVKGPDPHSDKLISEVKQATAKNEEKKLLRRRISKESVLKLQEVFKATELPSKSQKQALSSELGLPFEDVNAWFRNARRNSERKKRSQTQLHRGRSSISGKEESTPVLDNGA